MRTYGSLLALAMCLIATAQIDASDCDRNVQLVAVAQHPHARLRNVAVSQPLVSRQFVRTPSVVAVPVRRGFVGGGFGGTTIVRTPGLFGFGGSTTTIIR